MLDDVTSLTLRTALAGLSQRQQTTANNIANVETPGFLASQVDFENSLATAVANNDPGSARTSVVGTGDATGQNGNNVSLEREIVTATKTTLQEQLIANAITTKFSYISSVLKG
ncbi:flagellar basal body rod protein FlgB [Jatrophihabitans fulvus]